MRPDLTDLLSGVQRLLQGEIAPALADPYLQEQATYAFLLLEYAKKAWPREHLAVREEHEDLRATLGDVATHLAALPSAEAQALAAAIRSLLADAVASAAEAPLDTLLAADRTRRAAVEDALVLLDRLERDAAAPATPPALRATIDAYLCRQAARREAALRVFGIGW